MEIRNWKSWEWECNIQTLIKWKIKGVEQIGSCSLLIIEYISIKGFINRWTWKSKWGLELSFRKGDWIIEQRKYIIKEINSTDGLINWIIIRGNTSN